MRRLRLSLLAFAFLAPAVSAADGPAVAAVDTIGITVSDVDRSVGFFTAVLAFEKVSETEVSGPEWERLQGVFPVRARIAKVKLGDETVELTEYLAPRGRPMPPDSRGNDGWFQHIAIVVRDMEAAYAVLRRHRVPHASSGPQRLPDWNPNAGGIRAFYFRDPDGHFLELIQFPPGKGDPKWQKQTDRLFLGIDHTAIVVSDTEASLRFYCDLLGMKVAGESENWGDEQEHLNGIFGARLRITALRASSGPGIEFLEYIAPRDGRARPSDARANDLLHWQTGLVAPDLRALDARLAAARAAYVSPGLVRLPGSPLGFQSGLLVGDPDGHALRIVERGRSAGSH